MYNVLQLFLKYGAHLLFIGLQMFCFSLIINYNKSQREILLNSSNVYVAKLAAKSENLSSYFNLQNINDSLMRENATLIENLILLDYATDIIPESDSIYSKYNLISSTICNNTIHLRNNHITLCKGSREGIRPNMGVISSNKGIVGIVRNVSTNYAHVMSILNSQTRISCAIKGKNGTGNLVWKNLDPLRMTLESIPKHEEVSIGDTIITSGYSTMFPKGILVGKVERFIIEPGSNSFSITVKLFNKLSNIKYAYVVQNRFAAEQISLEAEVKYE
ncbi:MAG: rod shape-determining protein MreC [Saprospiraceae bacterium]|nr:rod shape-determining protein MreC [Saprospiraceae bacterium]